ncbi:PEP-CTERM protein-sorting domain-containing protein [Rubrivivax sp. A210]|nr:PEP-CTERM protein-sorting domain-containing protein [Rubrivivax sp. A210]
MSTLNKLAGVAAAAALMAGALQPALAATVTVGFEQFADLDSVTNQIAGMSFSNATVLRSGAPAVVNPGSLADSEFPPHGGDNVVVDEGGAITIDFTGSVFSVGAYFTYVTQLTFVAFDSSGGVLGSDQSTFQINTGGFLFGGIPSGDAGSSPNEFLSFSSLSGSIARIVISGDIGGSSFVMDDLTVDTGNTVPEPMTLALVGGLLGAGVVPGGWLRRRKSR